MIPYPLQGHVIPFANLAMKLASNGFTITFVNTQSIHHQISRSQPSPAADIFAGARGSGLDIRYATVGDDFPLSFDRSLNHDQYFEGVLRGFSAHVDQLVGDMVRSAEDLPLTCIIADTFYVWASVIADKYNLVNVSFWTEPSLVFTLYYHMDLLLSHGHFDTHHDNRKDTIDYIPGVRSIEPTDLTSYLQLTDTSTVVHRILNRAFQDVRKSDFILCNAVHELEPETFTVLNRTQPVYPIGPIFPTGFTKSPVATNLWSESDCTAWLDSKPRGSVLYVSIGSYAHVTKPDIGEIARGLLMSGVSFIWVLRPDIVSSEETHPLPVGFEEEIKTNGLILPWCSQIDVIAHRAIGGFLTHCGWNSVLEGVWCGVPLICFPLLTDQFTNRKLAVDDWRIGINLCDERPIRREEVAENVNRLMSVKSADELRENVLKVKGTLESALGDDGSSRRNLGRFIDDVKAKVQKKRGLV